MKTAFAVPAALLALSIPGQAAAPPFDTPARVAFMKDLSSGAVLYAKNQDQRIPPASMAKMMTVLVAFDMLKRGELKLDQKVTVRPETWRQWHGPQAGSTMFLETDEQISIEELLHGIVTLSGNDACVVLAEGAVGTEAAFVQLMNAKAKAIGMADSRFGNTNGWPDEGRTYVTARDLATLAAATIEQHPALYDKFYARTDYTRTLSDGKVIRQANRDPLLGKVAGADGLKTGHTDEAGYGFTGSADQGGRRIVMVVAGLDSYNGRAEESVRFMDWGFRAWDSRQLAPAGKLIESAPVQQGDASSVGLVAPRALAATLPKGQASEMRVSVAYDGPIKAPIAKGQHVADLIVRVPDMPAQTVPLVAESAVGEAGFFRRAWNGLMALFG